MCKSAAGHGTSGSVELVSVPKCGCGGAYPPCFKPGVCMRGFSSTPVAEENAIVFFTKIHNVTSAHDKGGSCRVT